MKNLSIEMVFIGIATSFVATIVWVVLSQLYDVNGRKKIDYQLELVLDCMRQFEHALKFNEYHIALAQTDRILDIFGRINGIIKPFTYRSKKRKLVMSYIYNVYYALTIFKNLTVGYSGEQELNSRCEKFSRNYMYEVELGTPVCGVAQTQCFFAISIEIVQYLNRYCCVRKALLNNISMHTYSTEVKRKFYLNLISPMAFKDQDKKYRWYPKYYIRNSGFTKLEYKDYITKRTKRWRSKND